VAKIVKNHEICVPQIVLAELMQGAKSEKELSVPEKIMTNANPKRPVCIIIAGPNGAGKTTFAKEYLPESADEKHVNPVNPV